MDGRQRVTAIVLYATGLVVLAASTTAAYLGMRDVMAIGGSCASGGPYEIATPCPEGTALLMTGGIVGWFVGAGLTLVAGSRLPGSYSSLALLAWPGLFLSLGWNFLDFGLDPANGGGADAGLVFCGVLFVLMGGLPLVFGLKGMARALWPPDGPDEPSGTWGLAGQVRGAASRARPANADADTPARTRRAPRARARRNAPPQDAPPQDAVPGGPDGLGSSHAVPGGPGGPGDEGRAASGRVDVVGDLERLADLHRRGAIDDDEFERAKDMLLDAGEDRR